MCRASFLSIAEKAQGGVECGGLTSQKVCTGAGRYDKISRQGIFQQPGCTHVIYYNLVSFTSFQCLTQFLRNLWEFLFFFGSLIVAEMDRNVCITPHPEKRSCRGNQKETLVTIDQYQCLTGWSSIFNEFVSKTGLYSFASLFCYGRLTKQTLLIPGKC